MKNEIIQKLENEYANSSKSFKKIIDFIKYNQSIIAFISVNKLAEETETSPATVTRFAQNFGFKGYPEFQEIFQKQVEKETSHMRGFRNTIAEGEKENILSKIVSNNIEVLNELDIDLLDEQLDQAVEWIKSSRKLYILGARGSYSLAHYLYFMLKEFREGVELMISGASDFTDKLLYSQKEDMLFTISFYPYTNFTCQVT
ncbi:MAG: MurR/RpiR family transcriptional regulator, partial [Fusobacteriaceae bacterium]